MKLQEMREDYLKKDAGNVEKGVEMFNNSVSINESVEDVVEKKKILKESQYIAGDILDTIYGILENEVTNEKGIGVPVAMERYTAKLFKVIDDTARKLFPEMYTDKFKKPNRK